MFSVYSLRPQGKIGVLWPDVYEYGAENTASRTTQRDKTTQQHNKTCRKKNSQEEISNGSNTAAAHKLEVRG